MPAGRGSVRRRVGGRVVAARATRHPSFETSRPLREPSRPVTRLTSAARGRSLERMSTNIFDGEDRAGIFSAVQHKRFRPLWAASILSGVAYVTALTACGWVAFDLHHHSSTVGLVVFASFLPALIITPFAGVFADRYDRRMML